METKNGIEAFYAKTRQQWRRWLKKNSQSEKSICLIIYHKKSKTKCIPYNEAIEEALCYGWIDSRADKRDPESFYQRFSPRKANSNWSNRNIERVERMVKGSFFCVIHKFSSAHFVRQCTNGFECITFRGAERNRHDHYGSATVWGSTGAQALSEPAHLLRIQGAHSLREMNRNAKPKYADTAVK